MMKYKDFKSFLTGAMYGDKSVPEDAILKPFVLQALIQVAEEAEPLVLQTTQKEKDILKPIENGKYIQMPSVPETDEDFFILDRTLVYAVAYLVAYRIGDKKDYYNHEANIWINKYQWNIFESAQAGEDIVAESIEAYGHKKMYVSKVKGLRGYEYTWDENFIELLNDYLAGSVIDDLSKSYRTHIDNFILYTMGTLDTDNPEYEDYAALNEYLGSL